MKTYLVGGAVRDQLLGITAHEHDWVVVGASPDELLALGYQPVGKDFPVFLHPETHEEYALARTERKTGPGYTGFEFHAAPDVTLEDDLKRRDLTINAIAQDETGKLIDPYNGQHDIEKRVLRHVSPAFAEDPVRILRVARFAARFAKRGFTIADETIKLMRTMTAKGEVDALVPERVWQELVRALAEPSPTEFFNTLNKADALAILFPELKQYDTTALERAAEQGASAATRFAILLHQLNVASINDLCARYRAPREFSDLALLVAQYLEAYQTVRSLPAEKLLQTLSALDVFRRPERCAEFIKACQIILNNQDDYFGEASRAVLEVETQAIIDRGVKGREFGEELQRLRLLALQNFQQRTK